MSAPATTTNQGGHYETVGNGGRCGVGGYQPRPSASARTQAAGFTTGTVVKTPTGAYLGTLGTPE